MKPDLWFTERFEKLRAQFTQRGDYSAFMEALLLCTWNERPLPDWVANQVVQQAEKQYSLSGTRGPGKQGNWQAAYDQKRIDDRRANLAEFHLNARSRRGRGHVSELATLYGYGKPSSGGANVVTKADVFGFVSKELRGTPAQGAAGAVEESYEKVMKARKRGAE
ncbi:MAG: hypothetical protein GEU95_10590 [Rhizobiales bacterium]|nr:hypothetical protein [Hyphomicrobiales bacterium]